MMKPAWITISCFLKRRIKEERYKVYGEIGCIGFDREEGIGYMV